MKKYIWHIIIILIALVIGISAYYYGKSTVKNTISYKEIKLSNKIIDSIKGTVKPIEKEVIKYVQAREKLKKQEKEIVYPEEECKEIVDNLQQQLENCDKVVELKDTIIYKERLVIQYKDKIIEKMVVKKPKPFGIGFQAGYGTNGKEFFPYVGGGVSYNFARF